MEKSRGDKFVDVGSENFLAEVQLTVGNEYFGIGVWAWREYFPTNGRGGEDTVECARRRGQAKGFVQRGGEQG